MSRDVLCKSELHILVEIQTTKPTKVHASTIYVYLFWTNNFTVHSAFGGALRFRARKTLRVCICLTTIACTTHMPAWLYVSTIRARLICHISGKHNTEKYEILHRKCEFEMRCGVNSTFSHRSGNNN